MSCYQLWGDILIPLISAIIGGLLTFLGVYYTIRKQEKKEKQEEILKYKPYLKISNDKCINEINCKKDIQDDVDLDKDLEVMDCYYSYLIDTFYIKNSENAECVIKEIILDSQRYALNETLLLNNEIVGISTTKNLFVATKKLLNEIYLTASDLLGNLYYYKCEFKNKKDSMYYYEQNEKVIKVYRSKYVITNISLPIEKI